MLKILEVISYRVLLQNFFNEELDSNNRYFLLLKVRLGKFGWRTFHHGIITSQSYLDNYINFIQSQVDISVEHYKDEDLYEAVAFHYFIIPKNRWDQFSENKWVHVARKPSIAIKIDDFHNKYNIPLNNNYSSWGDVTYYSVGTPQILIIEGKINYTININEENTTIIMSNDKFIDIKLNDRYFKRIYKNFTYYIDSINGKIVFTLNEIKTDFLSKTSNNPFHLKPEELEIKNMEKLMNPKIGTFDIETIVHNGIHKAYLYSFYVGESSYSYFADKPGDIEPSLNMFKTMLNRKYKGYTFYAHNFSGFDVNFILNSLSKLKLEGYKIVFMKNNDKFINISISHESKDVQINLRDSLLILPMGLSKLGDLFNVDILKSIEPVYVNNKDINNPFNMEDLSHYNKEILCIPDFNLWKDKVTSYCEIDCISLYQIMIKFRELVFNKWNLFIDNYPTTPSLSFAIFRRHYLEDDIIPIYKGKIFNFLRESFTGGATEIYKPYGKDINCYDVNSLIPFVMAENKYPVGNTYEFIGDINLFYKLEDNIWNRDNSYFIADVEVETLKDLYQPYLQVNHLGKENGLPGNRTISPIGSFNMKINSCEYNNAIDRKDYNIVSSKGYLWFSKSIFNEFVNNIYNMRNTYPKSDPMNLICKLILNSLYGRFAMKPIISTCELIDRYLNIWDFMDKNIIEDHFDINKDHILMTYRPNNEDNLESGEYSNSIAIASAITAYARVYMSKFKNNPLYEILYTDTDSAFIKGILPDYLIGNKLGQFKLENTFKEIIFLGPKIYSGITIDDKLITKIKGFKNAKNLSFSEIKTLLNKDSFLELNHIKWFRTIDLIEMKLQPYILSKTENKREFIYQNGIAIDTKAFKLKNNFII